MRPSRMPRPRHATHKIQTMICHTHDSGGLTVGGGGQLEMIASTAMLRSGIRTPRAPRRPSRSRHAGLLVHGLTSSHSLVAPIADRLLVRERRLKLRGWLAAGDGDEHITRGRGSPERVERQIHSILHRGGCTSRTRGTAAGGAETGARLTDGTGVPILGRHAEETIGAGATVIPLFAGLVLSSRIPAGVYAIEAAFLEPELSVTLSRASVPLTLGREHRDPRRRPVRISHTSPSPGRRR